MCAILIKFDDRDDILLMNFLVIPLVAENLGTFILASFTFIFHNGPIFY